MNVEREMAPGKALLGLLALGTLWGASFPLTGYLVNFVPPEWIIAGRIWTVCLALGLYVVLRQRSRLRALRWRDCGALLIAGALNFAVPWVLMANVLQDASASMVTVSNGVSPLLSLLFAAAVKVESFGLTRVVGLLLALLGVAVMTLPEAAVAHTTVWHVVVLLLAMVCYSIGGVFVKLRLATLPMSVLVLGQLIAAAAVLAVVCLVSGNPVDLGALGVPAWICWAILTLLGTALAQWLFFYMVLRAGPVRAASGNYFTVVVGAAIAIAIFGEPLTWYVVVATALVLIGLWAGSRPTRARPVRRDVAAM